jgi:hypothetical protein
MRGASRRYRSAQISRSMRRRRLLELVRLSTRRVRRTHIVSSSPVMNANAHRAAKSRSLLALLQSLTGVLSSLRCHWSVELRSPSVVRKQQVFERANDVGFHFCRRKHRIQILGYQCGCHIWSADSGRNLREARRRQFQRLPGCDSSPQHPPRIRRASGLFADFLRGTGEGLCLTSPPARIISCTRSRGDRSLRVGCFI